MTTNLLPTSAAEAFAALDHAQAQKRAAEVAEVLAITAAVEHYDVDEHDALAGMEALHEGGSAGTPEIGEFLAMEIGGILGISPLSAASRIASILDVRHRHPAMWEAFLTGEVWFWQASKLAAECTQLSVEAVAIVDRHTRIAFQMGMSWGQVMYRLPAWIIEADPERARSKEREAREARFVRLGKLVDGCTDLYGKLDGADGIALDEALDAIANTLPAEEGSMEHRRAAAVGILARQAFGQDQLTAEVVIHLPADAVETPDGHPATVEGWGVFLASRLPEFLKDCKVTIRPVIDPNHMEAVDAHDPPASMRLAMRIRNPHDVAPYGTRHARHCDADHTEPFRHGMLGQTRLGNLGPLSRRAHRAKTFGGWQLVQTEDGIFHWRSPFGYEYLVTAFGTTRLRTP
ncbi:MAG: DUF222 domain-containing protein, partial [Propionibacterium sp.]|nr:DUF222 domain-containing protein [Propionibacterium sp.]